MATIIRISIANGHRPQVDALVEANPGTTRDEAAQLWVARRYGDWITRNVTEGFTFERVSVVQFDVVFAHPEHAGQFQAALGGQEVADDA